MSTETKKRGFLVDMHYFRAFAILNVMLVHILQPPHAFHIQADSSGLLTVKGILFHNSTIYFIFISGFLFQYLSYKFNIRNYYKAKVINVITPYVINSLFIMCVMSYAWGYYQLNYYTVIRNLLLGETQTQYWYIPFVSIIFLISPFLLKIKINTFTASTLLLLLSPLLGTRTGVTISPGMYIYFFPIYCFGMICAIHYEKLLRFCKKYNKMMALIAILSTAILYEMTCTHTEHFMLLNQEGIYYIQKMSILFLAIHLLQALKGRNIRVLHLLANYSFSAYFLHIFVGKLFTKSLLAIYPGLTALDWSLLAIPSALVTIALTLGLAVLIKKLAGPYSRMLIGA
nr:acyltransferase [uncultured Pseudodesulfovibrio sp.]